MELTNRKEELFPDKPETSNHHELRFYNLRVASKGQVRTAPTAVTWVNSLLELAKVGDKDLQGTLNSWNAQAPKADKVTGQKFATVKNLLDVPGEVRSEIFNYINQHGWDSFLHKLSGCGVGIKAHRTAKIC